MENECVRRDDDYSRSELVQAFGIWGVQIHNDNSTHLG